MDPIHLEELEIQDFGPIEYLKLTPKAVTTISGTNDQGKTFVLKAVKSFFVGGHNPDDIRRGAKKAVLEMKLSDGVTAKRTITRKTNNLEVLSPNGDPVEEGPATYLKSLASGIAFDPIKFLDLKPREQSDMVLSVMPVKFTPEEITGCWDKWTKWKHVSRVEIPPLAGPFDLGDFGALIESLREDRKTTNRARVDSEKTVENLRKALPPEPEGGDWGAALDAAKAKLSALTEARQEEENAVERMYREANIATDEEYERRLRELNEWRVNTKAKHHDENVEFMRGIALRHTGGIEEAQAEVTRLQEGAAQAERAKGAREQLDAFSAQLAEASQKHEEYEFLLEKLAELKVSKLKSLPVDGLGVDNEGLLTYNDLPLDNTNTAALVILAVQIACMAKGPLGLMILDRAESLAAETWEMFVEAFRASGMQIIASRVTTGPRLIETVDAA